MEDIKPLIMCHRSEEEDSCPILEKPTSRVASVDVFRGLCVLLMIFVDYAGSIFPVIAHSPWTGLHLADFVMPFFLFVAGFSVAIAYKKVSDRVRATGKAVVRASELFLLGVFLQGLKLSPLCSIGFLYAVCSLFWLSAGILTLLLSGGYLHGASSLTYGVDIENIRLPGILQRITIGYVVAAFCEIWLPCQRWRRGSFYRSYCWQWFVMLLLSVVYLGLLYGLYVPDWQVSIFQSDYSPMAAVNTHVYMVNCSVRGDLGPACNSAGMIDRYILGVNHLYSKPVYRNLKECNISSNSQVPASSPSWCLAPFDPEGILSSLAAAVTSIIGLQFGHILIQLQHHKERLWNWFLLSISLIGFGLLFNFLGMPLNKSLYTISYMMVTSGCAGITFCILYTLVDVNGWRWPTCVLEWMGKHSLRLFILITSNIIVILVQGFYVKAPQNNVIRWIIIRFVHK